MKALLRIYTILITLILFLEINSQKYRCGTNKLKIKPKALTPQFQIKEDDPSYKRRLADVDKDGFKRFNIYVDKYNIKQKLKYSSISKYQDTIINALDRSAQTLQNLLKVKATKNAFQFSNKELRDDLELVAWDRDKFGSKALSNGVSMLSLGIDLVIFSTIEEMDDGVIAAAGPYYTQSSNSQPILGMVFINNKIDFSKKNIKKYLESTLIHEMTHILGFVGSFFQDYFHNVKTKKDKYGIERQYITSAKVIQTARKYYNCSTIDGVELEEYGGDGTAGSHWEARILLGDYMNGVAYTEEVISEFTLALLEDTGIYKPYYYTGGLMRYGKNKGCEFVYDKCVDNQKINTKFENEFFDNIYSDYKTDASCSSGRISRTYNTFWKYSSALPQEYQYFNSKYIGGWGAADYCPLPGSDYDEEADVYYTGICSGTESGTYGSQIFYSSKTDYILNKVLAPLTGEEISDTSFCLLSSLFKSDITNVDKYSKVVRATCYKIYCSIKSLTIKINDDYIVCPRSGGKIKAEGYKGYLLCPDYNLMCGGTVICNDLFDCVDKKSLVKESSYKYDYTIKTSQDISKAETSDEDDVNNYELSNNGVCSQNCKQCYENNICIKCRENYNLVGNIQNTDVICLNKEETAKGYFKRENNIYYECIDYCDTCSDFENCEKCQDGIEYNNNKCINLNIPNCEEEDNSGVCQKCNGNYTFNSTNRNFCIEKIKFNSSDNYYTKDNGVSYSLCSEGISECNNCQYNSGKRNLKCTKCISGYILSVDENLCLSEDYVEENIEYYNYIDGYTVKEKTNDANDGSAPNYSSYIKLFDFSIIYLVIFILSEM